MAIRQFLDGIEHHFEKGGKYERWYALYEAVDTIFYSPASVTSTTSHVRDGIDLKRIMITVWLCTFPAMFFGMWNIGFQANSFLAENPDALMGDGGLRTAFISALAGNNAASIWDNFVYGMAYFVPIYFVTFVVGGFWEVLFATVRRHEVNEGFFVTSVLFALVCPPTIPLAGRPWYHLRCGHWQGSVWRYRQELPEPGPHRSCVPVFCLSGPDFR